MVIWLRKSYQPIRNKKLIIDLLYNNIDIKSVSYERCYRNAYYCSKVYFKDIKLFRKWFDEIISELNSYKILNNIKMVDDILLFSVKIYRNEIDENFNVLKILNNINEFNKLKLKNIKTILLKKNKINSDIIQNIINKL